MSVLSIFKNSVRRLGDAVSNPFKMISTTAKVFIIGGSVIVAVIFLKGGRK